MIKFIRHLKRIKSSCLWEVDLDSLQNKKLGSSYHDSTERNINKESVIALDSNGRETVRTSGLLDLNLGDYEYLDDMFNSNTTTEDYQKVLANATESTEILEENPTEALESSETEKPWHISSDRASQRDIQIDTGIHPHTGRETGIQQTNHQS